MSSWGSVRPLPSSRQSRHRPCPMSRPPSQLHQTRAPAHPRPAQAQAAAAAAAAAAATAATVVASRQRTARPRRKTRRGTLLFRPQRSKAPAVSSSLLPNLLSKHNPRTCRDRAYAQHLRPLTSTMPLQSFHSPAPSFAPHQRSCAANCDRLSNAPPVGN